MNIGTATGYLDLDTSKFKNGLQIARQQLQGFTDSSNSVGTKMSSLGSVLKTAGATMTKNFTVPILGAGVAAGKMAMDTDQSMSKVNSILQLGGKEFQAYEQTLKKGAQEIGMAYTDYADAAYDAISAGVEQGKVTEFLTGANKLAKGGLTDLTSATNLLTTAQNAYGLSQSDLAHVSDVLIQTQNKGKVTVNELASCMGKIIPTAKSLGVNMDQLGAGYSIMTSKGIASAEATTYMNSMFNELGKSGTNVDKALREISGKSFKELTESGKSTGDILQMLSDYAQKSGLSLTDLFGSAEAGKAALTLLSDGSEEFNNMLQTMGDSAGATDNAFNEMNNTAKEKLTQSFASLKNALSDIGVALEPVVRFLADIATKLGEFISRIAETNPQILNFITVLLGIIAAVGPVMSIIGTLCSVIGGLITFFSAGGMGATILAGAIGLITGPVGIVIGVITALTAVGILLYKNWDTIRAKCVEVWQNNIQPVISNVTNAVKAVITTGWNGIKSVVTNSTNAVKTVITTVFNAIKTFIQTVVNGWKNIISTCWNGIKTVVSTGANAVRNTIRSVFSTIENILTAPFKAAQRVISGILGGISSAVGKVTSGINKVVNLGRSIPSPASLENIPQTLDLYNEMDYSNIKFNYGQARETSMTDTIATNLGNISNNLNLKSHDPVVKTEIKNSIDYNMMEKCFMSAMDKLSLDVKLDGYKLVGGIINEVEHQMGNRLSHVERGLI